MREGGVAHVEVFRMSVQEPSSSKDVDVYPGPTCRPPRGDLKRSTVKSLEPTSNSSLERVLMLSTTSANRAIAANRDPQGIWFAAIGGSM